jgi:GNAT superfamily N-acetyltransferase
MEKIIVNITKSFNEEQVLDLYRINGWSSANKPKQLIAALKNSHSLVVATANDKVVGIGNAISDGHLVVYYPHMIVHPAMQGKGIGGMILDKLQTVYKDFHQQMLTADGRAIEFYEKNGFERAGETQSMWIYSGGEH